VNIEELNTTPSTFVIANGDGTFSADQSGFETIERAFYHETFHEINGDEQFYSDLKLMNDLGYNIQVGNATFSPSDIRSMEELNADVFSSYMMQKYYDSPAIQVNHDGVVDAGLRSGVDDSNKGTDIGSVSDKFNASGYQQSNFGFIADFSG